MLSIFFDMMENFIEVFMDDFFIFYVVLMIKSLDNINYVLKRWIDSNLVLNWVKYHFMVT